MQRSILGLVLLLGLLLGWDALAFYHLQAGRWLSRDPLLEAGAVNWRRAALASDERSRLAAKGSRTAAELRQSRSLDYVFCRNVGVSEVDTLGLQTQSAAEAAGYCSNPCEEYKQGQLAENEGAYFGGGVVCCGGKKYACTWDADAVPNALAREILQRCQREHEMEHFQDVDCAPCDWSAQRPGFRDPSQQRTRECQAHWRQLYCLQNSGYCNGDPECEALLEDAIKYVTNEVRRYCGSN